MRALNLVLFAAIAAPGLAIASTCPAPAPEPLQATSVVPIANELAALSPGQLGAPNGVLARAHDEVLALDQVLLRIRLDACRTVASVTQPGSVANPADPAAYKPRTEFDNTPWRFNMSQNGKNMTADEFSAWMKSRGVRVARGAGTAPAPVAAPAAPGEVPVVPPAAPELATPASPTAPPQPAQAD